jgi:hypothetical protein
MTDLWHIDANREPTRSFGNPRCVSFRLADRFDWPILKLLAPSIMSVAVQVKRTCASGRWSR